MFGRIRRFMASDAMGAALGSLAVTAGMSILASVAGRMNTAVEERQKRLDSIERRIVEQSAYLTDLRHEVREAYSAASAETRRAAADNARVDHPDVALAGDFDIE